MSRHQSTSESEHHGKVVSMSQGLRPDRIVHYRTVEYSRVAPTQALEAVQSDTSLSVP